MAKKVKNKKSAKPAKKAKAKKVVKSAKKAVKKIKVKKVVKKVVATKAKAKPARPAGGKVAKPAKKAIAKAVKAPSKAIAKKPIKVVAKAKKEKETKKALPVASKSIEKKHPQGHKPMLTRPAPVAKKRGEEQFTSIPGIVKKDEFVIDKRPLSELNINMGKSLVKRMDVPKPKPQLSTDKRTKYSDKELQEFKQIIIRKLDEARKDYELLKSTLSHKDDHGTDDTSPTFKLLEDGSDVLSKEETAQLAGRQEKFIQSLQNALVRIENKTYGICRITGKLISKERLRSVPHATLAIEAKLEQTSSQ